MRVAHQKKIMAWLSANNIKPSDVPIDAVADIRDGRISCPVVLRRNGNCYLDARGEVAKTRVDVPLIAEPNDGVVRAWLAGRIR